MTAPALDGALDDAGFVARLAPQSREARVRRRRALLRLEVVETDADGNGDTLAADDAFEVAESGDRIGGLLQRGPRNLARRSPSPRCCHGEQREDAGSELRRAARLGQIHVRDLGQ